jgi:hypothetical protein
MEELVDRLAENTHNVWARERISQGWTYGLNEDSEKKRSPHLVLYQVTTSIAGWHVFKTKIPIWVNFGRSRNGRSCWYFYTILFYGQMVYYVYGYWVHFVVIWYIFPRFDMLYREKTLQTW